MKNAYLTKQDATRINDGLVKNKMRDILRKNVNDKEAQKNAIKSNKSNKIALSDAEAAIAADKETRRILKAKINKEPPVATSVATSWGNPQQGSFFNREPREHGFGNDKYQAALDAERNLVDEGQEIMQDQAKIKKEEEEFRNNPNSMILEEKDSSFKLTPFSFSHEKMDVDDDRDSKRGKFGHRFGGKKTKRRKSKRRKSNKKRRNSRKRRHTKRRR